MHLPDQLPAWQAPAVRGGAITLRAPPPPQAAERSDLIEIARKLWRQRFILVACAVAAGALGAAVAVRMPSHYVAEARILVGVPVQRIVNADPFAQDVDPDSERVQNEAFVIQSRGLAKQVIDRLHLADDPEFSPRIPRKGGWWQDLDLGRYLSLDTYLPPGWRTWLGREPPRARAAAGATAEQRRDDQMVSKLLSKVDVSMLGRSHVLSVQADSENPDVAAQIANALADAYLQQQRGTKLEATNKVEQYLERRTAELRQQVEKSEQAVEDYRRQNGLYKGANAGITSQQLSELNTQLILAQTAKAEADARLREAQSMRRGGIPGDSVADVLRSPLIQALKQQQAEAERKLAELSASYGERHPKVINARAEINDIRRKVQMEINRVVDGLQVEARTADARYQALRRNFDQLKGQMGGVNEKSIRLEALEREATVSRNLLEAMLSRAKETLGQQELQQADARIISPAAPPESPSYPPKSLMVFLAAFGGTLIGLVAALLRESVDQTFRRGDQVEAATGLPVLSMVPHLAGLTPPTVHVLRKPVSPYSEALRRIYIGMQLSESERSPKTMLVCSATPAEGKSVMAASLGRLLASNGKRVMVIDCDWRCPTLHQLFRCPNKGGLAALLTEEEPALDEVIRKDAHSGLDLIVAGAWTPQRIHMLTSERMRVILEKFAQSYDVVILDSPPVLVGAEVLQLARMVDKVAFIVRWGHTLREAALDAMKQLVDARADFAGVVLSRVDSKRYRQYGYGHLNYEYARPSLIRLG